MIKRITILFLAVALLLSVSPISVFAYDAEEHDAYLEQVLFGNAAFKDSQTDEVKKKVQMLEYASYLAIDQNRGEGADKLKFLKEQKVKGLPKLKDFDLTGIFYGNHRNYTHRGWDYVYMIPKGEKHDKANWAVRKNLLCSTVNAVFDFELKNELFGNVCDQCDSFCAMLYYVHILGDHIERDTYKINDLTMPLAREHADKDNLDVFLEIKTHCEILFSNQRKSATYSSFMQEIDILAEEARTLAGTKGGINESNYIQYHEYSKELMELLKSYVPLLLENEEFFKAEFYSQ